MPVIYLLHFERPYVHACHYLGITNNLERRLKEHEQGNASALTAAVSDAGIGWRVARTWLVDSYSEEYQLKQRKNSPRLCPICNPATWYRNGCISTGGQHGRADQNS